MKFTVKLIMLWWSERRNKNSSRNKNISRNRRQRTSVILLRALLSRLPWWMFKKGV